MQGFILNLNKVKDEDLIVTILSENSLDTLYRFYGARHGVINLGFKIDYEKESSPKSTISRLKDVIHIGYKWINSHKLLQAWQDFTALFHKHLRDAEELDNFYFDLLEYTSKNWDKRNHKRVAIEAYIRLLEHEGRLHVEHICFLCSLPIKEKVSLIRAYLPTHKECTFTMSIEINAFDELFKNKSTLFLTDKECDRLWIIMLEGL